MASALLLAASLIGCKASKVPVVPPAPDAGPTAPMPIGGVPVGAIPGHDALAQDVSPKEGPRLLPPETLIRTYLSIFGGLSPLEMQARLRAGGAGLFDTWNDYLATLGLPDYRTDIPRNTQTSPVMLATFERIGIALCDKAVEADLRGMRAVADRQVFAFELTAAAPTDAELQTRLDVLHRTFLSYPLAAAPAERFTRLRDLYRGVVARRLAPADGGPRYAFTAVESGWAAVCYAFVRHPEFHLY